MREVNFDGLIGPTHNYAGLSAGNVASKTHGGNISHPKAAALQGLEKMRTVRDLGVVQAVLPPQPRPHMPTLRRLGFAGSDEEVLQSASEGDGLLLRLCASAASMWTANAATVAPSKDTSGKVHFVPANLQEMFHRSIEADVTRDILRTIFAAEHFVVHDPLPGGGHFADEGAANHTRLSDGHSAVHLLAYGRQAYGDLIGPKRFPARQTREASAAVARLLHLDDAILVQQDPRGIDAGAFHTDVVAVGNDNVLLLHEFAFAETEGLLHALQRRLPSLEVILATDAELPVADAVAAYPFNSQLLTLPSGKMTIIAPIEAEHNPRTHAFLSRCLDTSQAIESVHYLDVRQSMNNGGGPACLRLRVPLREEEMQAIDARVFLDDALYGDLVSWVKKHYPDRLTPGDLRDPVLLQTQYTALDELSQIMRLGSVYDFQKNTVLAR